MSETIEPQTCRAYDGDPCDCPQCEARHETELAYWMPLYRAEKAAGLTHPVCLHCGAECKGVICQECGSPKPLRP